MNQLVTYTDPQLCTYGYNLKKPWFVYFEITNLSTGETQRKQFRGGINYFKTKEDRLREGRSITQYWKKALKEGWSPFDRTTAADLMRMSFNDALVFALDKCDIATKSKSTYKTSIKYVKEAAVRLQMSQAAVTCIKRQHIKLILDKIRELHKLSNSGYNKHLSNLCSVMGRLVQWEVIESNPAEKITKMRTVETQKFIPYTQAEKKTIHDHLFIHHYNYFVFLMVVYHTGIRPKEALSLKIKDINLGGRKITIYPNIETENSKTKSIRAVPVNEQLLPFLRELKLHDYPNDYFIFGSPFPPGQGNRGSAKGGIKGSFHPDYCKPSSTPIKRDTLTRLWKTVVIDKLGIEKYQYAMKHTGADDKIMAGIDIDALRELYGHSSKLMTEKYARKVKEVYRELIINKSPAFN